MNQIVLNFFIKNQTCLFLFIVDSNWINFLLCSLIFGNLTFSFYYFICYYLFIICLNFVCFLLFLRLLLYWSCCRHSLFLFLFAKVKEP